MRLLLTSLVKIFARKNILIISFLGVILMQGLFAYNNKVWPDFAKVTGLMPDFHPEYSQGELSAVLAQYIKIKPAVLTAYGFDMVLPVFSNLFFLSALSLLIKYLFKKYNFLGYSVLILPLVNLPMDYLENILIAGFSLSGSIQLPELLLRSVTSIKLFTAALAALALFVLSILALKKRLAK